jgi:hypothetical protein
VNTSRSTSVIVAIAAVIGVMIGAIAVIVLWPDGSGAEAVTLERADVPGDDPFTESVQTDAVPAIEQPALDAADAVRADLPQDETTAVLVATGTAPGLYGGSGDLQVCDADKLVGFLNDNPDKAAAFGDVLGIAPAEIADYVASLTPVVLLSDTLVTNHGFQDGQATAFTSVLQAGTAVMVDRQGVPRVKCNCGNPLTPPQVVPTSGWDVQGDAWDGFDEAAVTGVVAGDTVDELTLCDLVTGENYTVPVGSSPTSGTAPPNLDGEWTLELRNTSDLLTPLTPGRLDAEICPTAHLEGAVLVIRGTHATIADTPQFGDWEGTVEGAPEGSPGWLDAIQRSVNGAVIKVHPVGEDIPELTFNVATSKDGLSGLINVTVQDRYPPCDVGVVATRVGSTAPPAPTTTSTSTTSTTVPSAPAGPTAGSGGQCGAGTLIGVVRSYESDPIVGFTVDACNERWAAVSYGVNEQDDAALLEWNGSAWETGACQKYRDPSDWTKSTVVPPEFWIPCISG